MQLLYCFFFQTVLLFDVIRYNVEDWTRVWISKEKDVEVKKAKPKYQIYIYNICTLMHIYTNMYARPNI